MLSILIFLFSLSQTSSLIISLNTNSKQTVDWSQDTEETENTENQEIEFDSEIQDLFNQFNFRINKHLSKHYLVSDDSVYSQALSLPETPPPDSV